MLVSTVVRLTAVPVVVDTSRGVTLTPEIELPAIAVVDPVDMSIPFTVTLFASVIVPLSVGVFAALPVTVRMPPTESVAPAPMSCWLGFIVYAPVVEPEPFST